MKRFFSLFLLLLLLLCSGCSAPTVGDTGTFNEFFAMDTIMRVTVHGDAGEPAASAAREEIERLEKLLSRTLPDSQVSQLNAHAGEEDAVALEGDLISLLTFARSLSADLDDALDITIAPVMDAWGFTTDHHQIPTQAQLDALLPLVDCQTLEIDPQAGTARLPNAGMAVDLGAVAKGFAAGRAESVIRAAGADSALLDLGRNITAIGVKPTGEPWRVAVQDPQDSNLYLGVLALTDQTCSTSGGYERYFEEDGVVYHHIIDPSTGYPAHSGLLSVTVVSPDALLADALSTALFVAGPERALDYWRREGGFELILCGEDGVVTATEGLEDAFAFQGEDGGYTYEIARR